MTPFDEETRQAIRDRLGPGIMQHPCVLRMERNMQEVGIVASEVYRIEGASPDRNLYFDIYSLRKWAHENVAPNMTGLNTARVHDLIKRGSVDLKHIEQIPPEKMQEPIIIGIAAHENGMDAVLDGQHRYVAMALQAMRYSENIEQFPIIARFIEPDQWQDFLIPRHIAVAMQMDASY